ncbi:carbohydrate-binding protein [Demequina litorisediminis]|uniref:carbohydrate-binding protein n=1 Tax=Demequina litorisediminis TaxID=1849022 RepID=UPI003D672396
MGDDSTAAAADPWSPAATYGAGDVVTYDDATWVASWWTRGQAPGGVSGPWQEVAAEDSGIAVWTASRTFTRGDVVTHGGEPVAREMVRAGQRAGGLGVRPVGGASVLSCVEAEAPCRGGSGSVHDGADPDPSVSRQASTLSARALPTTKPMTSGRPAAILRPATSQYSQPSGPVPCTPWRTRSPSAEGAMWCGKRSDPSGSTISNVISSHSLSSKKRMR